MERNLLQNYWNWCWIIFIKCIKQKYCFYFYVIKLSEVCLLPERGHDYSSQTTSFLHLWKFITPCIHFLIILVRRSTSYPALYAIFPNGSLMSLLSSMVNNHVSLWPGPHIPWLGIHHICYGNGTWWWRTGPSYIWGGSCDHFFLIDACSGQLGSSTRRPAGEWREQEHLLLPLEMSSTFHSFTSFWPFLQVSYPSTTCAPWKLLL